MSVPEQPVGDGRVPSVEDLFLILTDMGVALVADGERLRVRAPRGVLTTEVRTAMELRRDGLHDLVAARFRGPKECLASRGGSHSMRPCPRMGACPRPIDGRPCLVPAICCICGARLDPGRRYCCPTCADHRRMGMTTHKGDCRL